MPPPGNRGMLSPIVTAGVLGGRVQRREKPEGQGLRVIISSTLPFTPRAHTHTFQVLPEGPAEAVTGGWGGDWKGGGQNWYA